MVGCPAHSGDTNRPGNTRNGFGGLTLCPSLGGEFSEARSWRGCTCVLAARRLSRFSGRGFRRPTPAAWGTQVTYVRHISRVEMVHGHENKSDRLREGFDRQAGGARRFAGSAGGEDPG